MKRLRILAFLSILLVLSACTGVQQPTQEAPMSEMDSLKAMAARFAPVEVSADISRLPDNEQKALAKLVRAGLIMDAITDFGNGLLDIRVFNGWNSLDNQ